MYAAAVTVLEVIVKFEEYFDTSKNSNICTASVVEK
jgi:hypothetical protein